MINLDLEVTLIWGRQKETDKVFNRADKSSGTPGQSFQCHWANDTADNFLAAWDAFMQSTASLRNKNTPITESALIAHDSPGDSKGKRLKVTK